MSEKAPTTNNQEIADIVTLDTNGKGHRPDGKFLSQQNMDLIAEHQDKIRDGINNRNGEVFVDQSVDGQADNVVDNFELRPVADGEYQDSLRYEYNTNPEHEDYLPIGAMAHEPWTITPNEGSKASQEPPVEGDDPADQPAESPDEPVAAPKGRYGYKGTDLYNNGRETVDGRDPENHDNVNQYGYAGPVEKGSEIELAGPTDIMPYDPGPTDIEPVEKGGDLVQQIEVDPALLKALDVARTRYALETAKSRKSYLGRFLQTDSRLATVLRKVPGFERVAERLNGKSDQAVVEAKEQYETLYNQVSVTTVAELHRVGWDEDMVRGLSLIGNIAQDSRLESEILHQRQSQSKGTNRFVNWWVSQKGFTGKLKKAGVVIAAGAATGLTGGLFAGAVGSLIAGGASGAAIANHVTKRRANGIDKESGLTVAVQQSTADHAIKGATITERHNAEEWGSVEDITGRTERRTYEEMLGNRKRIRTAVVLGKAAGMGAFGLKELFKNSDTLPKNPTAQPPTTPKVPQAPPAEAIPRGPKIVDIAPGTDGRLPWTHVTERLGNGNGTPDIFQAVERGKSMGIDIVGRGRGLESVTYNGVTYTDNAHINAALDYIMDH